MQKKKKGMNLTFYLSFVSDLIISIQLRKKNHLEYLTFTFTTTKKKTAKDYYYYYYYYYYYLMTITSPRKTLYNGENAIFHVIALLRTNQ